MFRICSEFENATTMETFLDVNEKNSDGLYAILYETVSMSIDADFKHIYFTPIAKQVLTKYTNLSRFCFLGITSVLATTATGSQTQDLMIVRPTLQLTTTDTMLILRILLQLFIVPLLPRLK